MDGSQSDRKMIDYLCIQQDGQLRNEHTERQGQADEWIDVQFNKRCLVNTYPTPSYRIPNPEKTFF